MVQFWKLLRKLLVFQCANVFLMEVGQRFLYGTQTRSGEVSVPDLNVDFKDGFMKLIGISPQGSVLWYTYFALRYFRKIFRLH